MTSENIAVCFAPTLFRRRIENFDTVMNEQQSIRNIICHFIEDYDYIFGKTIGNTPKQNVSVNSKPELKKKNFGKQGIDDVLSNAKRWNRQKRKKKVRHQL